MAFGTSRGGRTPPWAAALQGLFSGIGAFQEARQQAKHLKRQQALQDQELVRQRLHDEWASQDQAYQQQQRAAAPAVGVLDAAGQQYPEDALALAQRRAAVQGGQYQGDPLAGLQLHQTARQIHEADQGRQGLTEILTHLLGQGPEHVAPIASALQSVQTTGKLPQVDTQFNLPVGAPGLPGAVQAPQHVRGELPLGDVIAAAGKSQAERALEQRAAEAQLNRDSRERVAGISAGSKQYKSWDDFRLALSREWLKGGGDLYQLGPYLELQRDEWNRQHPTAPALPGTAPDAEGSARPPLVLPGAAAKIGLQGAQTEAAKANAAATPKRIVETNRHNLATEGTATSNAQTNALRATNQNINARLNREQQARLAARRDTTMRRGQDLSHGDRGTVQTETNRHNLQMEAARKAMSGGTGAASNTPEMQVWRARVKQQRDEVSQAWSLYSKASNAAGKAIGEPRLDALGTDLAAKRARLQDTIDNAPAVARASPSTGSFSPAKKNLRQQALQDYITRHGQPNAQQRNWIFQAVERGDYTPGK